MRHDQKALPFYDPRQLEELYISGYKTLVLKIIVKIKQLVE
jgi:hypothetical protein